MNNCLRQPGVVGKGFYQVGWKVTVQVPVQLLFVKLLFFNCCKTLNNSLLQVLQQNGWSWKNFHKKASAKTGRGSKIPFINYLIRTDSRSFQS
jgi:hypothetical protein